ncbi:hypothetical protein BGZ63DRAFT_400072 [Mariannaea sp. PMI_226]|nr:hypothetical protein BGZ63DRAFT_400072 [Mariannaea sp. PMI_226]
MLPRWNRLWALLCLCLAIQIATAASFRIAIRDENASQTAIDSSTKGNGPTKTQESDKSTNTAESDNSASTTTTKAKGTKTAEPTSSSTVISSDGDLDNSTFVNVTIPNGQLPIEPKLTPGWGVAGVIMLGTGVAHTLIGIKNQWIHTFFSTAFVGSLGVSVLIVYVMSVPVSNAVQGGYVVAAVMSGCGLGAASLFFRELLEVLGCALGGFCVSMWLLCLKSDGLLDSVVSRAIFISCFTLAGFVFYFSRYTRDWALILMIAFSGATVTVLGIDCFSRAGLKEFWAWIWQLNNDLFPLGAEAYPVTKGIRVETAATIIIFLIGVISQIKLWKIVRDQREKRAQELAEDQRNLALEEENVGRNIEEMNARERRQWERAYGNGEGESIVESHPSDSGDVSEKKMRNSNTDSSQRQSTSEEVIEMSDLTEVEPPQPAAANLMTSEHDKEGVVMVRVAEDDAPPSPLPRDMNDKATVAASDDQTSTFVGGDDERRLSKPRISQSPAPEVIPLPFVVPPVDDNDEACSDGERSSVATFADDEDGTPATPGLRTSFAKRLSRLSQGSAEMLRSLSHRPSRVLSDAVKEDSESTEELVIPRSRPRDDDDGSMAATIDDESISQGDRHSVSGSEPGLKPIEITAKLSDRGMPSPAISERAKLQEGDPKSPTAHSRADPSEDHAPESQDKPRSVNSAATSSRLSLTKDRLPKSMSRVAMSYRTNEWAKHLSQAETPEPDELRIVVPKNRESAAPVLVEELKKTADEGTPPPAPVNRSDSRTSMMSYTTSRRSSKQAVPATLAILNGDGQSRSPITTPTNAAMPRSSSTNMMRRTSGGGPIEPIAEEHAGVTQANPIPEESDSPDELATPPQFAEIQRSSTPGVISYSSPQTLIGQREMFLRNKSQGNLLASPSDLNLNRTSSDAGSLNNYPMYAAAVGADADDIPLSQRKQLIRQNSLNPSASTPSLARLSGGHEMSSTDLTFDSHQPQRVSALPTPAARQAALASFRQQVAQDLRAGTPVINNTGRETPFTPMSLLGGREADVQRNIEMGRNILMGQKEAEAQRREKEQIQREWADRAFDERMRSGDLLEAHREAMRKMQRHARDE